MSLVALFETLKSKEIKLNLDDRGDLKVIGRRDRLDQTLLAEIKEKKSSIVSWLKEESMLVRPPVVAQARTTNELPTSFAQQRLWFIDQLGGGSPQYNLPGGLRIRGRFSEDIAERALRRIIERHEPLRTVFRNGEDGPVQVIREHFDFQLQRIDLSELNGEQQEQRVREAADADAVKPFDLSTDLMLRASFIRLSEAEGALLFNVHHIASDGWSTGILINEFSTLYEAFSQGVADPLPPLEVQYADYAQWQREWLAGEVLERQVSYWEQQLAELPQVHGLPLDHPRPAVQTFDGALHWFTLDHRTLTALKQIALAEQATLFMVLQGLFALVLARYSNSEDIVLGTPVANRLQKELEPLVGFFVNTLVLRTNCRSGRTFREYLREVKQMNMEAQAHQDVPFEYLVERLKPQRTTSHAPLFQIMFSMNTNEAGTGQLRELQLEPLRSERLGVKFDLLLDVLEDAEALWLSFAYNTDLFDRETIERLATSFVTLTEAVAVDPQRSITTLPIMPAPELQRLLVEWNDTAADYAADVCVHSLFEAQVKHAADALAVTSGQEFLTYRELNARANQLARYLRRAGVGPEVPVGILLERSVDMVVAILSVLKAGGAYLPLDRANSRRSTYMLHDAGAPVLLTQHSLAQLLDHEDRIKIFCLDTDWKEIAKEAEANLDVAVSTANLAYVIYTSGSTGQPKGVEIPHAGLLNLVNWHQRTYGITANDRATQLAGPAFDASVWELWPYLTAGASIHIADDETRLSALPLLQWLADHGITICFLPTPLAEIVVQETLPDSLQLRAILTGGDVLHRHHDKALPFRLVNHYGPTENTVVTTSAVVDPRSDATAPPPIGSPIANTQVYLLDKHFNPAPVGVSSELFAGGAGLARGYHERPELTAEKFIPHPFSDKPGARLYRTGDAVRYRPDGQIEFLGRLDDQVKVRGFRIELGEVQHQLAELPGIESALVIAREDEPGDRRLVAYVTLADNSRADRDEIIAGWRRELQSRLPDYMVPSAFVILDEFPITANGKLDRKALPVPGYTSSRAEYVAPATETEIVLAQIWANLLKLEPDAISATANFFELGGHSLLSVRLVTQIRAQWNLELQVRDVFEAPQLSSLAAAIDRSNGSAVRPAVVARARTTNELPTSFAQQRLWFIDKLGGGSPQYNIPGGLRIRGRFSEDVAEQALRRLVERHEPLRTIYRNGEEGPVQVIREQFDFQLQRVDLSGLPREQQEQRVREAADADAVRPFDLSTDLMLRASFIRLSADEGVLLFNVHHIASDGWSTGILINEFSTLYEAFSQGAADPLPPLEVQYGDYAQWQREWLAGEVLERQVSYWEQQLAELPQVHGLPLDHPRPAVQSYNGALHTFTLDHHTLTALKQLALAEQATLFMVLQGLFALVLSRHSHSEDIVLGTPVANRLQKELEPLVGFFVNTLVLRTDCRSGRTFREYLRELKHMNLDAQAHQDVPFEYLVERLKPQRTTSHAPLFQIMFSMNTNEAGGGEQLRELELEPLRSERVTVKFDLLLDALEDPEQVWLSFAYKTDLFEEATIARLGEHFQTLARGVAANADERLEQLPLLSANEQRQLLYELNETAADYPRESCLHELFEAQAEARPEAIALRCGPEELSYRELNEQANQLAHYLREQGVGPDVLVGLCVERSVNMVVGILGVLKAGGAYVPLEPRNPQLHYLIKDSEPLLVLTQASLEPLLVGLEQYDQNGADGLKTSNMRKLRLDADREWFSAYPIHNPEAQAAGLSSKNLAYVIYTSGSTGKPKGVMIEHASVVNLAMNLAQHVGTDREKAWAWVASYAFDSSVKGLAQLLTGRPLLIVGEEEKQDPRSLLALLERHRPGVIDCTPSLLELWLSLGLGEHLPDLVIGGEKITPALWQQLVEWQAEYGRRALNVYGPTECCVDATGTLVTGETPHIGRPWSNVGCYVLDADQNLTPQGSIGELYIGGDGLARGYLHRPQLTVERFPQVRLGDAVVRLYRTGDLVRYLPDGNLEFLGRCDDQVKVRGYRIELGEIEAALQQHDAVREALVLLREDVPGDKRLVAYVSLHDEDQIELNQAEFSASLRQRLLSQLPDYMVPGRFVIMDHWPLTANGKIDRQQLPAPDDAGLVDEYIAPATETESILQTIWQEVLAIPRLSVTTNFFAAGGHSLLAVKLISKTNEQFGQLMQMRDVFERQSIREMAAQLDSYKTPTTNTETQSNLLRVKSAKADVTPLFLVHPVGGYAHCYYELARNLDYQGAVFGLQVDDTLPGTVEGMAERYVEIIKNVQPDGPYLLGGWSMGGVVSYEIARQLRTTNEIINPLIMIDSFCPNSVPEYASPMTAADEIALLRTLAAELGITDQGLSATERQALGELSLEKLMELFVRLGREQQLLPADFDLRKRYATVLKNSRAARAYRAMPSDVEIQLIRAQQNRNPDWSLGWSAVAKKATVRELPGDHFSLVRQPDVFALGKAISKLLSTSSLPRQMAHTI